MTRIERDALADAFAARRCAICGRTASVVCPGSDAVYTEQVSTGAAGARRIRRPVSAPIDDINLCLAHASERWPWRSERTRRQRCAR